MAVAHGGTARRTRTVFWSRRRRRGGSALTQLAADFVGAKMAARGSILTLAPASLRSSICRSDLSRAPAVEMRGDVVDDS